MHDESLSSGPTYVAGRLSAWHGERSLPLELVPEAQGDLSRKLVSPWCGSLLSKLVGLLGRRKSDVRLEFVGHVGMCPKPNSSTTSSALRPSTPASSLRLPLKLPVILFLRASPHAPSSGRAHRSGPNPDLDARPSSRIAAGENSRERAASSPLADVPTRNTPAVRNR